MIKRFGRGLTICALLAVAVTGCHKPSYTHLEPSGTKWSVAVIAQANTEEEQQAKHANLQKLAAERALATQIRFVKPEELPGVLNEVSAQKGLDLVIVDADAAHVGEASQRHLQTRFAVLGAGQPSGQNVRSLQHDRKRLLFLAGFLAAEANKQSAEPFTVLVDKQRPAGDEEWQMIINGARYAGRKDAPLQILASSFAPAPEQTNQAQTNNARTSVLAPVLPKMSGRALLTLGDVALSAPEQAWTRASQKGMAVIRTDQSLQPIPLQSSVAAQPASFLETAYAEEAQLLAEGRWQGQQTVQMQQNRTYRLALPGLFPDKNLQVRLEQLEDLIAAGHVNLAETR